MHTELYCETIEALDRVIAIRAIHSAWLQLTVLGANCDCRSYDNAPVLCALRDCLHAAGHPGFAGETAPVPLHVIDVEVYGGVVQEVSDIPAGVGVRVIDYDNIAAGDPPPVEPQWVGACD